MSLVFEEETYKIIGCCFEVHSSLGRGFKENVYKDALVVEFNKKQIPFEKEKSYKIIYKGIQLQHYYVADFVLYDKIILEIKAMEFISETHVKQTINYLAVSNLKVALLVNFGCDSLKYRRVIL